MTGYAAVLKDHPGNPYDRAGHGKQDNYGQCSTHVERPLMLLRSPSRASVLTLT